ncbi:hypothetical protein PbJCM13498_33560 [Prolixibacter bellariivorans]|uniref:SEFIR domain-containing protein n=1 Tax=Prolixibacter bellariivorans TaxID=314319 RepID=A0A5M4B3W6_9BACT|nr:toll/interleukin-1 receptor domain-containing protein [Prolixibacter bellariivorans]GET34493.1 hypothetical protein PbJCM13498_33560 [Prolixibacter bellariivorans]
MTHKTVFVSYSWDNNEEHKEWVLNLSNNLVKNGIDVWLDQYDLSAGHEMTYFMEKATTADKVLVILTPNYKLKADKREGGVGYEYSLLTEEFYNSEPDKSRIIPILRDGTKNSSCPAFLHTRLFHDMRNDNKFDSKFFELIKIIVDKPLIVKPPIGKLPEFDNAAIPEVDKTILDYRKKEEFHRKKNAIIDSEKGVELFHTTTNQIVQQISESLQNYTTNFGLHFEVKTTDEPSILLSTINYTFYFGTHNSYSNSATNAYVVLNFFKGPVGLSPSIDYRDTPKIIYKTNYKFDLEENLNPIFVKKDNSNIKLTAHEIATVAVREVIVNEIKLRESKLRGNSE